MTTLTEGDRRLLTDCAICGFVLLGPSPDQVTELVRDGLLTWHWNGGTPVYEVTEAGRAALAQNDCNVYLRTAHGR